MIVCATVWDVSPADAARRKRCPALCCLAQFMVILDVAIVNVALPSIREDLDFIADGPAVGRQRLHA